MTTPAPPARPAADSTAVLVATLTSAILIGVQMAGKATRDALFLSTFDVAALPAMVIAASLTALGLALAGARLLPRLTPGRLVPIALLASSALFLLEWALLAVLRRPVVVLFYLHYSGLGALLISGFWSLLTERFDPRAAKRHIGRIAAGGTVGGLLGGLLAERAAVWLSTPAMLPILAGLQVVAAILVWRLRSPAAPAVPVSATPGSGFRTIGETPYLRGLVAVVVLVSLSEGLIDFVFKARAAGAYGRGEELLRLFAVFYTATGLLTAIVQALATRPALQRLGLAPTVALMPGVVAAGSAAAVAVPGLGAAALLRGTEMVLRNSLYRAGYELLFTPLPTAERRATKTLIDVGALRLGDVASGGLVQLLLLSAGGSAQPVLLILAAVLAAAAVAVTLRLQPGYVAALERNLVAQAVHLDPDEVRDLTTRTALLQSVASLGLTRPAGLGAAPSPAPAAASATAVRENPLAARVARLRAVSAETVRAALSEAPLTPELAGHAIPLLARDDVSRNVLTALRPLAARLTGQLVDHLLDPTEDFAVRRRIPVLLAEVSSDRAVEGLLRGLEDRRFEVRFRCARALGRLHQADPALAIAAARVEAAVLAEVAVDRALWDSRRLLDAAEDDADVPLVDEVLRDRADRSLEHVFTLLALLLPRQPLTIAFRGLHTTDPMLRGTALEYLESALPERIRAGLWPYLEDSRPRRATRPAGEALDALLRSRQSIALNLEELRRRRSGGEPRTD